MDKQQRRHQLDSFAPLDGAPGEHVGGAGGAGAEMVDYMLGQTPPPPPPRPGGTHTHGQASFDKLSFSDVMHFADFGPKLALNQPPARSADHHDANVDDAADDDDDDDSYFFRFQSLPSHPAADDDPPPRAVATTHQEGSKTAPDGGGVSESTTLVQQQPDGGVGGGGGQKAGGGEQGKSGRRKRPRSSKTSEEVESQRMTHIAVERNRRRQMNDYLRVLRSLMPGSYVQRGDQASIIGGEIEFIRELEQLIQCLESQKRRRLYVPPGLPFPAEGAAAAKTLDLDACGGGGGLREEVAENKSCLGDIEVRVLGADAMIKVLSRRRPEQLIKTIAALEDMHMSILHTNITTIEQIVLYSFNAKIAGEPRFTAEDIAGAVHQILSFVDVNYTL